MTLITISELLLSSYRDRADTRSLKSQAVSQIGSRSSQVQASSPAPRPLNPTAKMQDEMRIIRRENSTKSQALCWVIGQRAQEDEQKRGGTLDWVFKWPINL